MATKKRKPSSDNDPRWISKAISKPGALKAQARKEGAITAKGTINKAWLQKKAKQGGKIGRRARLALTLSRFRK